MVVDLPLRGRSRSIDKILKIFLLAMGECKWSFSQFTACKVDGTPTADDIGKTVKAIRLSD